MKFYLFLTLIALSPLSTWASTCSFNGRSLSSLNQYKDYEVEFAVKAPFPPKLLETLEKYFGNFSEKNCKNAIVAAKIIYVPKKEIFYAFYTNQDSCDGGNSYGIVLKSGDMDATKPIATIEDSFVDCL